MRSTSSVIAVAALAFFLAGCDGLWERFHGDRDAAFSLFQQAASSDRAALNQLYGLAEKGDRFAIFYQALLIQTTSIGPESRELASELYTSVQSFPGALFNLALIESNSGAADSPRAVELLEAAAEKRHMPSILLLAYISEKQSRLGNSAQRAAAKRWYGRAIEIDKDHLAELRLGAMLQADGQNEEARKLLLSAAKYGYAEAQYRLSALTPDAMVATQWLIVASQHDDRYKSEANAALTRFSAADAYDILRRATMWSKTHWNPDFRETVFTAPVRDP